MIFNESEILMEHRVLWVNKTSTEGFKQYIEQINFLQLLADDFV